MANRLRIARLEATAYVPLTPEVAATAALHERLQAVLRRHLPPVTASLLAAPAPSADGRFVEWYSDLAGQPLPLPTLSEPARAEARRILNERLASIRELADRLPAANPAAADLAPVLRQALAYPGDEHVYVVGGQPVVTFWGHGSATGAPPAGLPPATPADAEAVKVPPSDAAAKAASYVGGRRRGRWWLAAAILMAAALAVAAWWYFRDLHWPPWVDYELLYAEAQNEGTRLEEQITALEGRLGERLERCALADRLQAAVAAESALLQRITVLQGQVLQNLSLCPLKQRLQAAVDAQSALQEDVGGLEARLAEAIEACRRAAEEAARREAEAAAEREKERRAAEEERQRREQAQRTPPAPPASPPPAATAPPAAAPPGLPPCPGQRPPEEAPDVAIVLDSSGSMRMPADMNAGDIIGGVVGGVVGGLLGLPPGMISGMTGSGPSRLKSAQDAVNKVVAGLPNDVDVGLSVLEDCPRASNYGFFSGAERQRLYRTVNGLQPERQTPLADGVAQAGSMVDGVRAPAVIVVVSDGQDTCRGDPCAVAARLNSQKPKLKINVVDIIGDGASNCLARATGGRVLRPQSGMAFEKTIKQATEEAQAPAHCR